jgi:hypothetical protein
MEEEEMKDPKQDPRRIMTGLKIHRDVDWDYSFWRPLSWTRFDMEEQYGFVYSPGDDPRTGFHVSVQDLSDVLETGVTGEDLPALREGILAGLETLPDCEILAEKELAKGFALGFEFKLTFSLDGETAKRTLKLLYNDRQQYTIYGQGVPPYEYDVFHDTYEFIYSTFTFGDLLAMQGVPPMPANVTRWEGSSPDVQTKPHAPRDHSAYVREKMREIDERLGTSSEEKEAES